MGNTYIKSPLNYVGGKYKLLPQIIPLFPSNINVFVDLFGGGLNVGVNAEAKHIVYNDLCLSVVQILDYFYSHTKEQMLNQIDEYITKYKLSKTNDIGYKQLREDYNKSEDKNPIMLYTLICYSFNNFNGYINSKYNKD